MHIKVLKKTIPFASSAITNICYIKIGHGNIYMCAFENMTCVTDQQGLNTREVSLLRILNCCC